MTTVMILVIVAGLLSAICILSYGVAHQNAERRAQEAEGDRIFAKMENEDWAEQGYEDGSLLRDRRPVESSLSNLLAYDREYRRGRGDYWKYLQR